MKETLLLTKHMRDFPENSHNIEVYEKNNGYSALKKVLKEDNPENVINEIKTDFNGDFLMYSNNVDANGVSGADKIRNIFFNDDLQNLYEEMDHNKRQFTKIIDLQKSNESHLIQAAYANALEKWSQNSPTDGKPELNRLPTFYKLKDGNYKISPRTLLEPIAKYHAGEDVDGIEKICQDHYDKYEETMRVQNQYNRLVFYSGDQWHTCTSYADQPRYTLRFFVTKILSEHQNFPLLR